MGDFFDGRKKTSPKPHNVRWRGENIFQVPPISENGEELRGLPSKKKAQLERGGDTAGFRTDSRSVRRGEKRFRPPKKKTQNIGGRKKRLWDGAQHNLPRDKSTEERVVGGGKVEAVTSS